jgi:(4-(4-[2-(gamma-L-glutamylamino)ethyl]phenoxymethyl)furan-2-yl)methanamine synthase
MQINVMGWDIGGAHLKASIIQPPSEVIAVYQLPCPLWKGIDKLHEAVQFILSENSLSVRRHVLTMTGELVDCFADRNDGVKNILAAMYQNLPKSEVLVYAGKDGILKINQVDPIHYPAIASANWLASATWVAQQVESGVFVDIGSTTTDVLLLNNNQVLPEGYTDYERLISQELVYSGIVRTAVMAVSQSVRFEGNEVGIMAEYFATMADVFRVTGELNEAHDQTETADGAEKSVAASAKRLARMIGCDYHDAELNRWEKLAQNLRQQQIERIQIACEKQLSRIRLPDHAPLIGAGIGRFLVNEIASNLARPYVDYSDLFSNSVNQLNVHNAADCAAAAALACLVSQV